MQLNRNRAKSLGAAPKAMFPRIILGQLNHDPPGRLLDPNSNLQQTSAQHIHLRTKPAALPRGDQTLNKRQRNPMTALDPTYSNYSNYSLLFLVCFCG